MSIPVAVVGAGHLGRIHTRVLRNLAGFTLRGVVDPVESQRRTVADEFQTTPYARLDEILDQVDALVIAAPTVHHHSLARQGLESGKHVFLEKPIASSASQADELIRLADRRGLALQVGHVERFNPAFVAAEPHLQRPKYIESVRRGGYSFRSTDIGVVLDLMIHDLDLVLALAQSPVRRVSALGVSIFGTHEDTANARIEFENGCVATLNASRASHSPARTMHVWTSAGFASLDFQNRTATIAGPSQALREGRLALEDLTPEEKLVWRDKLLPEHFPQRELEIRPADAITAELADFGESIRTGRSPRVDGAAGREAVTLAETILAEIAAHRWSQDAGREIGPRVDVAPAILPAPHFRMPATSRPAKLREAG